MEDKNIIINGHEAVNLGLSVKWATCNIGANKPEDIGDRYRWGELELPTDEYIFDRDDHTIIGLHYRKGYRRVRFKVHGRKETWIRYDISGSDMYDTARHIWGADWRMPNPFELFELVHYCTWEKMRIGNQCGWKIIGENGNSIFLPTNQYFEATYYSSLFFVDTLDDFNTGVYHLARYNHTACVWSATCVGRTEMPIRPVIG